MKSVAMITARGGSKRIPKKNIKMFCGKPIIAYSIEAALKSEVFDEVMVSTDSEEIAEVARSFGANVPFFRSEKASSDFASTADVLEEVLVTYQQRGQFFKYCACLYPTAPFITVDRLKKAAAMMESGKADGVIPVVHFSFPPQRAFVIRNGTIAFEFPEHEFTRSQDLEPIYHDCGQFYFCDCSMFLAKHSFILPRTVPLMIPEEEVQDIDTESDWLIAELKYKTLQDRRNSSGV